MAHLCQVMLYDDVPSDGRRSLAWSLSTDFVKSFIYCKISQFTCDGLAGNICDSERLTYKGFNAYKKDLILMRGKEERYLRYREVQFSSVAQSCPTLCDPMNHSTPGLPVHHQLLEFTQTHVHRLSDAIQPSHPLSSPSPPAPNPSQHQSLFQWVNSSHEVAKVLEFQL